MVLRTYSKRLSTTANTSDQEVFNKQWPVPVTIRAMKVETSDTAGGDLTVHGTIDGIEFLADSDAKTLEQPDWIPINAGPQVNGKVIIYVDNSHASNTPDISVTLLVDVGVAPPDNMPWIKGEYLSSSSTEAINKIFDKDAVLAWLYLYFTGGTAKLRVGGNTIMGDDEGFIDEPKFPPQGVPYVQPIPANVELDLVPASATGYYIVAVNKPR